MAGPHDEMALSGATRVLGRDRATIQALKRTERCPQRNEKAQSGAAGPQLRRRIGAGRGPPVARPAGSELRRNDGCYGSPSDRPRACFQASWPVSRSRSKPSSSRSGIPRSAALESFAPPGSAPTTTAVVFWETLPGALPPRDLIAASASSRDQRCSVPVTTTDMPTRVWAVAGAWAPRN